MLDPYRMVFVNVFLSIFLLLGVLFYKYIYPKKRINLFVLLILISVLPIISIFRTGAYESGDFNIHIYRIMVFFDALKEGIILPSWAGELNATYGNPLFLFNYTLPYYVISLLHFVGISFITATKLYLGLTLYFSAIFMYLFAEEITKNKMAAFSSAIFYEFAPYHLIDVHFRATLGESTVFLIIPLIFLFLAKYSKNNKLVYLSIVSLVIYLLFLSHPLLAVVILGIAVLFVVYTEIIKKNIKSMILQILSIVIGVFVSAYTWFPFIIYSPYMFHFPATNFVGFYDFNLLFFSPWRYGLLFQGPRGELATIIGYTQLFVVMFSIILIIYQKFSSHIKKQVSFWIVLFLITLFMMNPLSNILWIHIQEAGSMLTLYSRLSLALAFFTSIIAGYFVLHFKKKKKLIYLLIIITVGSTILNWGQRRVIPDINDAVLKKNVPLSTLTEGPSYFASTKWADSKNHWFSEIPQKRLDITSGVGRVKELQRTSVKHRYLISASTPLKIRDNTLFFPGWHVTSNEKPISILPGFKGTIEFSLPKGTQYVEVKYKDINIIHVLKLIGLSCASILILYIILNKTKILPF